MTLTLRVRLTAVYTAVFGLLLATVSIVSYRTLTRQLDADATGRLAELAEGLHGFLRFGSGGPVIAFDSHDASEVAFVHEATELYRIYDRTTGRLLVTSPGFAFLDRSPTPEEVRAFDVPPAPFVLDSERGRVRVLSSVGGGSSPHPYLLQVGASLSGVDATLARERALRLWGITPAVLLAAVLSWWMAGFALAPLTKVAVASRAIDIRNLATRLPVRGAGDELDDVIQAFNDTFGRLEHAVNDMRQFSTALAHELRTPLAALRAEIELDLRRLGDGDRRRDALASYLEDIDKLKRLIEQLLTLARAETGQIALANAPVDVAELGTKLVDELTPVAEARDIDLRVDAGAPVIISGDVAWLERLILNLVDNAIKFTPPHGRIAVSVRVWNGQARLAVADTGAGMTPAVIPRIFDRFFRADGSRSSTVEGAGLGLSLVRWIVDVHHGRIEVRSRPGEGSTFTIWLPLADVRAA